MLLLPGSCQYCHYLKPLHQQHPVDSLLLLLLLLLLLGPRGCCCGRCCTWTRWSDRINTSSGRSLLLPLKPLVNQPA
jgi:hypothetical protein